MQLVKYILIAACLIVINSCKNDLRLNAPYKEIPSIYAILNPNERIQMIRINKVFLGEGDANVMAKVADSINYPSGELAVTLERTSFGARDIATTTGNKYTVTFRDSVIEAKSGAFSQTQRVYVTSDKLISSGTYFLKVKNNKTGNVFTAKSDAVDSVKPFFRPLGTPYYPYSITQQGVTLDDFVDYATGNNDGGTIKFIPNSAVLYQMTIRFHFYDTLFNKEKTYHYVDYDFTTKNVKDARTSGQTKFMEYFFKKADMYTAVQVGLSKMYLDPGIYGRKMYKIQYLVYSTTQDYIDYMQYVTPSLSIVQNKPLYSNFDNQAALGIFTFRSRFSVNKELASAFVSEFAFNEFLKPYKFLTFQGGKP